MVPALEVQGPRLAQWSEFASGLRDSFGRRWLRAHGNCESRRAIKGGWACKPDSWEAQLLSILAGVEENQRVLTELLRQQAEPRDSSFEGLRGKDPTGSKSF